MTLAKVVKCLVGYFDEDKDYCEETAQQLNYMNNAYSENPVFVNLSESLDDLFKLAARPFFEWFDGFGADFDEDFKHNAYNRTKPLVRCLDDGLYVPSPELEKVYGRLKSVIDF